MIKFKCNNCGEVFYEEDADEINRTEFVDNSVGGGMYYETYAVNTCPECSSDDLETYDLGKKCTAYDEAHGCQCNCDNCPLMTDEGADE